MIWGGVRWFRGGSMEKIGRLHEEFLSKRMRTWRRMEAKGQWEVAVFGACFEGRSSRIS